MLAGRRWTIISKPPVTLGKHGTWFPRTSLYWDQGCANMPKKYVAFISAAGGLAGVVLLLSIWVMMFQAGFSSVAAKASILPQPGDTETVPQSVVPKQDDVASNSADSFPKPVVSSQQTSGGSSQQTPAPVKPNSAANPEQNDPPTHTQPATAQLAGPAAGVVWSVPTTARVVFITVDDGWYPSNSVLAIMRAQHVPISAFLIANAAQEHPDYWRAFLAAGGDIENHTLSHPDLTKESPQDAVSQIETAQKYLASFSAPTLFRPPYGDYNQTVCQAVYQAGIKHVIMWNAVMSDNGLQTYNGKPLEPGSIILLHWNPGLGTQLGKLLAILNQEHLGVASLPYALEHPDKFPIAWPLPQAAN